MATRTNTNTHSVHAHQISAGMHELRPLVVAVSMALLATGCFNNSNNTPAETQPVMPHYTINTSGGDSGAEGGSGGAGDYIYVYKYGGLGPIEVLNAGMVDASFTPTTPTVNLGSTPLNIAANTTIAVVTAEPAAGTAYMLANNTNVYISDGDEAVGDETPVTGIHVATGTTLSLGLNIDAAEGAGISLVNDFHNQGTVTNLDATATQRGHLQLNVASYISNSEIDTSGTAAGQRGGYVNINADYSIYNGGSIMTGSAASTTGNGGHGGSINLYANHRVENTGDLTSNGGNGAAGYAGGWGGDVDLVSAFGSLYNSGDVTARGGSGSDGGEGGAVNFSADELGDMRNTGAVDNRGGAGSGSDGGNGGSVNMNANGGALYTSGGIMSGGGNAGGATGIGGNGGDIYIETNDSYINEISRYIPAGDLMVSGDADASGGDGVGFGNGGQGGYFEVYGDPNDFPLAQRVSLLGYDSLDSSGGAGFSSGGSGDYIHLYNSYGYNTVGVYTPSGDMINEADLSTRGGNIHSADSANPAYGGNGGWVEIDTDHYYGMFNPDGELVVNRGAINTSGGTSYNNNGTSNGQAGYVELWGYNGATNSGDITAMGGADQADDGGTAGYGGLGNYIQVYAGLGPVVNSGNLNSSGGYGEYHGGAADYIGVFGPEVTNTGNLTANGGAADPTLAGSMGGDGGWVGLYNPDGPSGVSNTGTASYSGGAGETAGNVGAFNEGGLCLGGDCTGGPD